VATSVNKEDQRIIKLTESLGCSAFAGSEEDVLDRAYQVARRENSQVLIRITADCPLVDPFKLDALIKFFLDSSNRYDYAAFGKSFPEGQNAEIFTYESLETAWKEAKLPSQREHFTSFIWGQPDRFRIFKMEAEEDYSRFRWTVDEREDFQLVREILGALYRPGRCFLMEDIIEFLTANPKLVRLNSKVRRNQGYEDSLRRDRKILSS
jgi:spore coat polysaccharide biosynthesis protein SpsF (cytidylyltransferase family)